MNLLHSIKAFDEDLNVHAIIEIPNGSMDKMEYDKDQEKFVINRVLTSNLSYPFNYGFVPETWSSDNDPLDVMVLSSQTFPTGTIVKTRVIGLLETTDQSGVDSKLITVPVSEKDPLFANIKDAQTLDKQTLDNIDYFYKNYKINEPGKWVDINGYQSVSDAKNKLDEAVSRYHQYFNK
ncbi:MAG TPA: inorganic diphosphatase [Candidatus Woesebacteria bacterium]|nr:inorganic diphosphatase [Candidatus Woesebacteria bacterium]